MSGTKKSVCVIGAGPCGMSAVFNFANMKGGSDANVVCYEKQSTWGGLWNYSWRTGTDEFGERCHLGMYKHLWSNGPKECLELPDYTFDKHFGKAIPSFPSRPVIQDYLEGRWKQNDKVDLSQFIQFNTVVRRVRYNDADDTFTVDTTNLLTNISSSETFAYVIVAIGIFNTPHMPSFPGIESFEGRILHAHNFRDAAEFKDQRLLIVGSSYSAEDLALQCAKYGAKNVICTWRTKPMGFRWPKGIEERELVQKFDGKMAYFKDGTSAEIDSVILCTGYLYSFPFMEDRLRLNSSVSLYPANLYKGTVWLGEGNNKLLYMGVQDQFYTFTMFDAQALWACKYILGQLPTKQQKEATPKSLSYMQHNAKQWVERLSTLSTCRDTIDFQTDFVADLSKDSGYPADATKARILFYEWEHHKDINIVTYRDQCFASVFTGTMASKHGVPWWDAFDDSILAFVKEVHRANQTYES